MRITVQGWFLFASLAVLAALIVWDHSFQATGWVPSLGANIITMLATVVVLDLMIQARKTEAAAALLRDSMLNIGDSLTSTADTLVELPADESGYERLIAGWGRVRERLERDVSYCASDLRLLERRRLKSLEDKVRHYAEMGWGDYKGEQLIVGKDVVETWDILQKMRSDLYADDENMTTLFTQMQERIDAMVKNFTPYW